MEIVVEKRNETNAIIKLAIKEADYKPEVEKKIKDYSKTIALKGFRPGKAPIQMVRKMVGKDVKLDAVNKLINSSLTNYFKEQRLNIVGEPLPYTENMPEVDFINDTEFSVAFEIGMVPTFLLDVSNNVKLTNYEIDITDDTIQEITQLYLDQMGSTISPETADKDDFVYGKVTQADTDFAVTTMLPLKQVSANEVEKFVGKKIGDVVTFSLRDAFDTDKKISLALGVSEEKAAELTGGFEIAIENIIRKVAAELNQNFFDQIFGKDQVTTEEEMKHKFREILAQNYQGEARKLLRFNLQKYLVDNTQMDIPEDFLKRWLLALNKDKATLEAIEKEFPSFEKELRWTLIQSKFAQENDVKVTESEIRAEAKNIVLELFMEMGANPAAIAPYLDTLADDYLKRDQGKNYTAAVNRAAEVKVLNTMTERVSFETEYVSTEKFKELVAEATKTVETATQEA